MRLAIYSGMSTGIGIVHVLFRETCRNSIGVCGFHAVAKRHNLIVMH